MRLEVVEDVAGAAADLLAAARGHVALSGGSTPKAAYERARGRVEATFWLGDERVVPEGDERSNYTMATTALGAPVERVLTELGSEAAAIDYEERLRAALGGDGVLDLALMGLGPDGHTASLFPGKPALEEEHRWVVGVPEAGMEPYVERVTMTFPLFNRAHRVVFLVAGEDKAEAMARAFGDPPDTTAPSAHIRPWHGELVVLCDAAAASRMA